MDSDDEPAVLEFLRRESPGSSMPDTALLGKLVGDLVAVVAIEIKAESVGIRDVVVAHDVRKKRIGRFMLDELNTLAAKIDRDRLVVDCDLPGGFLQRVGFSEESGRMVRRVAR